MNDGRGGMVENFDGPELFASLLGEDVIDWLAESASKEDTASGYVLTVVSSSALIVDVFDEVDIVTASLSGCRLVEVVA